MSDTTAAHTAPTTSPAPERLSRHERPRAQCRDWTGLPQHPLASRHGQRWPSDEPREVKIRLSAQAQRRLATLKLLLAKNQGAIVEDALALLVEHLKAEDRA